MKLTAAPVMNDRQSEEFSAPVVPSPPPPLAPTAIPTPDPKEQALEDKPLAVDFTKIWKQNYNGYLHMPRTKSKFVQSFEIHSHQPPAFVEKPDAIETPLLLPEPRHDRVFSVAPSVMVFSPTADIRSRQNTRTSIVSRDAGVDDLLKEEILVESVDALRDYVDMNDLVSQDLPIGEGDEYIAWAEDLWADSEYREAIGVFYRAIQLDRSNAQIWYQLGDSFFHLEEFKLAEICSKSSYEIDPTIPENLSLYAQALHAIGEPIVAVDIFRKALTRIKELQSNNASNQEAAEEHLQKMKVSRSETLENIGKFIRENDLPPVNDVEMILDEEAYVAYGEDLMVDHVYDEAIVSFYEALKIDSTVPIVWFKIGQCLLHEKHLDLSRQCSTACLQLDPRIPENISLNAKILYEKGDHEKAIQYFHKSLDMLKLMSNQIHSKN